MTAKDEYILIHRTALTMMERNEWFVPYLDGAPRIRKPPMIVWLTRASFEIFGVSVTSVRIVSVLFSGLFILVVALIGCEITRNFNYGIFAALIALSTAGLAVQSRFSMLDIPTATFSGFGFYWLLRWCKHPRPLLLVATAVSLACGFLTKGPVVGVLFGSGMTALVLTSHEARALIYQRKKALFGLLLLFLGLSLPWYAYAYWKYPDDTAVSLQREVLELHIGNFTLQPIVAAAALAFPWTFLLIGSLIRPKDASPGQSELWLDRVKTFLLLWTGLSLLPFLFMTSFERYIMGSLMPISLLCAAAFGPNGSARVRVCSRLAILVTSLIVLAGAGFSWWFKTASIELVLVGGSYALFALVWWRGVGIVPMAVSATMLWTALVGFLYPTFGANAIPASIVERVRAERVFLYSEIQPAFLPITLGRSLERVNRINLLRWPTRHEGCPWIFVTQQDLPRFDQELQSLGVEPKPAASYKTLRQIEDVMKSVLKGETRSQWLVALRTRSLEPIKERIFLYRLEIPGMCETNSTDLQRPLKEPVLNGENIGEVSRN